MAERVYFHIGVPKSGTTFVQTTMWHNRDVLRERGWLYPGRKRMDHYHAGHEIRGGRTRRPEHRGIWAGMVSDLAAWPGQGLVSHEFLSMATPEQARAAIEAVAPAEVHVVVTVRDYVRQFPAVWQEALKMGSTQSLDEFAERAVARDLPNGAWGWRSQNLPAVVRRWAQWLPSERVHLVTLPPPGAPRGLLWERWCAALELDDAGLDLDAPFANESLGAPQVALMQRVIPHLDPSMDDLALQHRWLRQYFGHEVLGPQRGDSFGLRREHAQVLATRSARAARALGAAGYAVHGDLADLEVAPDQLVRGRHPDDVPDDEALETAARAIAVMVRDVRDLNLAGTGRRSPSRRGADPEPRGRRLARAARRRIRDWRKGGRR